MTFKWQSNPVVFGVIHYRGPEPTERTLGSIGTSFEASVAVVKGDLFGDNVYTGSDELAAMKAVEQAWSALPPGVQRELSK